MGEVVNYKEAVESRLDSVKKQDDGSGGSMDSDYIMKCISRNELGDGEMYQKLHKDIFVYNSSIGGWMYFQGSHWHIDYENARALAAVENVTQVYESEARRISKKIRDLEAEEKSTSDLVRLRKRLNERISALRTTRRRNNCLTFARTCAEAMTVSGESFDQNPWLLACKNCVVNLKTGEGQPGKPGDYLFKASPVEWQGLDAQSELWDKSLDQILPGNQNLIDCLRRTYGMALIGEVRESILVVQTGRGRNGKSIITETTSKALGPLAEPIRSEMLLDQFRTASSSGATPDIMALKGLRVAYASETDENCRISSSRVKWLTGNDTISGRNSYDRYEVQFKPSHTLFLLTNHLPHAPADDFAFWERMVVFPFELSFVNREPKNDTERRADPELPKKLEKELPGVLAWMVRGCLEYQQNGLQPPTAVKEAVSEYRRNEDSVADFIEECCVVGEGYEVGATEVYEAFEKWWEKNVSKRVPKMKRFGQWFGKRFERVKRGTYKYLDVALSVDDQDLPF